jgi:hypothetical protein
MLNVKFSFFPAIFVFSALTLPIFYFIKKHFFHELVQDKKKRYLSTDKEYIKLIRERFDGTYRIVSNAEKYNKNVDPVFFNKILYDETTKIPDGELEKSWRRRILFEFTPRGNVVMFYDPYKQGFSYYSDQNVSYAILNAVAMKYVITYRCRDFFVDEQIVPEEFISRILELSKKEEQDKKKNETQIVTQIDTKSGPFAKFKSYVKDPTSIVKNKITLPKIGDLRCPPTPIVEKDLMKNKFIYLGKTMNWKILKSLEKKKIVTYPKTSLLSLLENNSDVQSRVFSYKNFKAIREPTVTL